VKNKILIVAQREYFKVIKKASFWFTTLFFPIFIVFAGFISGFSSQSAEKFFTGSGPASNDRILILDNSEIISGIDDLPGQYSFISNKQEGVNKIKEGEATAFFFYPEDIEESKKFEVYAQDQGTFSSGRFAGTAESLLKYGILQSADQPEKIQSFVAEYSTEQTFFDDNGKEVQRGIGEFVLPFIAIFLYFILVFFASNFLLQSVSEEKENRMIETILSLVKAKDLIWGKLLGQVGLVFTQLITLLFLTFIGFMSLDLSINLPIDLDEITFDPVILIQSLFYIICGFLIMANIMVGVGAASPSYKEAQGLSSVFIILSILPIYFAGIIVTDPSGLIGLAGSYFPLTSPLILLFRNAMGEVGMTEFILSGALVIGYVVASFWLSFKLFQIGALELGKKISLKSLLQGRPGKIS
jgi:ABC-2 type transport system permease protein